MRSMLRHAVVPGLALALLLAAFQALAVDLTRFSPQGMMARVDRVEADFASPAVALGDEGAADPFLITCVPQAPRGAGRWVDPQHWVLTFERPLEGAVTCRAEPNPRFRDLQGQPLPATLGHDFATGGPHADVLSPWEDRIAEDQVFVLRYDTEIDPATLESRAHCEIQGLGEAVSVRLVTGETRRGILKSIGQEESGAPSGRLQLLQCRRLLPSGARVRLVVAPGIRTPEAPGRPPVSGTDALMRDFQVRDAFHATLRCTRVRAQAPCSPLFPIELDLSSPVAADQAAGVTLETPQGIRPVQPSDAQAIRGGVTTLRFAPPFAEQSTLRLRIPEDLRDDMGRALDNAARFPLAVAIDAMPPLVKFASGPFGIVERFAEGAPAQDPPVVVPLALRRVEPELRTRELRVSAGQARDHVTTDDVRALQWYARTRRLQDGTLTPEQFDDVLASRPLRESHEGDPRIDVRSRSMFGPDDAVSRLALPGLDQPAGADIELVGVPLSGPGLHVLEIASPRLGAALLGQPDAAQPSVMYVRSAVLVTNLSLHLKTGRDDLLVWVTALDDGRPVPDARVAVLTCDGRRLLEGRTDARGIWHVLQAVPEPDFCPGTGESGLFVTARIPADHPQAHGQADFSFVWSNWNQGIESWRFPVPTGRAPDPDQVAHAVLDRTLLHAGETVSMKLYLRDLTREGLRNPPPKRLPTGVRILHDGTGDAVELPVQWRTDPGGGLHALLSYPIPRSAHLGSYTIELVAVGQGGDSDAPRGMTPEDGDAWRPNLSAGGFRVESFALPVLTGSLKILAPDQDPAGALIAPADVHADIQFDYQSGGPARDLPLTLSAVSQAIEPHFDGYEDYQFGVPDWILSDDEQAAAGDLRRLILDKQAVRLDEHGAARVDLAGLPQPREPQDWRFEATFADPNGEIQTIARTARVWPAAVAVGLQAGSWMARGESASVRLVALDPAGRPQPGVAMQLDGRVRTSYSTRKRLVGGFYQYDSFHQVAELGTLCQGRTDARGQLECPVRLERSGEIQLFARALDAQGRRSEAARSIQVWGDEAWFEGGRDDRIDVIPSRASYRAGETAELTVRMPFRRARALVAVEREGVLETHVVELEGKEPVVRLPVQEQWGPNVYISVLVVRGRIRALPWSTFLDWGWRHPYAWVRARADQQADAPVATGLVDLARPSFRFGLTRIGVENEADRLRVAVRADRSRYRVRETARVDIQVDRPDGRPAAGGSVAFAAVDEALLELRDNASWDLRKAMRVERDYGVETASGQGEVVGRRHYGRKAVPAGGGGGFSPTRELFDTLLLWRGDIVLDKRGHAQVEVPLNDALTRFRLVAIADLGADHFGTGQTDITTTQDLQIVSGLPRMTREGDRFQAQVTLRNRTDQAMDLEVAASLQLEQGAALSLPGRDLRLEAGESRTLGWPVTAPALPDGGESGRLIWTFEARSFRGPSARDRLVIRQDLQPAVPVTVRQATLLRIPAGLPVRVPLDATSQALRDARGQVRGGIRLNLRSSLAGTLPGVQDWLARYPYTCMEQLSARALGMRDAEAWQALMRDLPSYQTDSGLLAYFPGGRGSLILTAQLIEVTERARALGWPYGLPDAARGRMLAALRDYVQGRLGVREWAPAEDDFWRKLIAIDALALAGAWQPGLLDSFELDVGDWPTPALVTWLSILQQVPDLPGRAALLARADAVVRARLGRHGTTLVLADETARSGWWLMSTVATAQARLLMAVLARPEWQADRARLLAGLLSLQARGAWSTTTANVLGVLAVNQFSARAETAAGQGAVAVALEPRDPVVLPWDAMPEDQGVRHRVLDLPWPEDGRGTLSLRQQGGGGGWATVTARAAVAQTQAVAAGLQVERSLVPVSRARPDRWTVGDIVRVRLRIQARDPLVWAVISDPVPAGATILGSGLGRDSAIAVAGEAQDPGSWWNRPSFIEREAGLYRAYYEALEAGSHVLDYTLRLNLPGEFQLPPTRAEALYQPDVFGSLPNAPLRIEPRP